MVQVSGGGEDHVAGVETAGMEVEKLGLVEVADGGRGAQDGLAQGVIFPEILSEEFVDQDVGVVFVDLDFFKNHSTFPLDVIGRKNWIQKKIEKNIECDGHVVG